MVFDNGMHITFTKCNSTFHTMFRIFASWAYYAKKPLKIPSCSETILIINEMIICHVDSEFTVVSAVAVRRKLYTINAFQTILVANT